MLRLLTSGFRLVFVAAAIWASISIITFAQTTEPVTGKAPAATRPVVTDAGSTDDGNSIRNGEATQAPLPVGSILPTEIEVEIQNRFNELRRESLDNRANAIDWWLAFIAIVLTVFGIVIPIFGFFGFRRFREIETEAKTSVNEVNTQLEEAKRTVKEIKRKRDEAEEMLQGMNAQTAVDDPEKASQAVESIQENPDASPISKTIALAVSLQQEGKTYEAIEKWRAVAHVAEESDKDQAAAAWFSVGYLVQGKKPEDGISAYDEAIRLKPDYAVAYYNRGVAKGNLERYDDAIADYDEAIRLKPDYVIAYNNRGNAKAHLGRYDDAIADCDETIRLKPNYADAYNNRGIANHELGFKDEARKDFETVLNLARNAGNADLMAQAEELLRTLNGD